MGAPPKHMDVLAATDDLRRRTLVEMTQPLERLIYLASTRDYNTGLYYHHGLAARFSEEAACEALAGCHREAFEELVAASLEELVHELEAYLRSTRVAPGDFIAAWKGLEPYRVAVPVGVDSLSSELVFSNLKVALAILEAHLMVRTKPGASRPLSPVQ
jgi:hypothetical protein